MYLVSAERESLDVAMYQRVLNSGTPGPYLVCGRILAISETDVSLPRSARRLQQIVIGSLRVGRKSHHHRMPTIVYLDISLKPESSQMHSPLPLSVPILDVWQTTWCFHLEQLLLHRASTAPLQ